MNPVACEPTLSRPQLARERARLAREGLSGCHFCEHHCAVNRLAGERGLCRAGPRARVFSAQVEVADEIELIPTFAIALSGCDLHCGFCITGAQSWNPQAGETISALELAARAKAALSDGARSVMILGGEPTVNLPAALAIVAALPGEARLVWKTNAHASATARALLEGLFDVWLVDYKYGNDTCALRLSQADDYTRIVRENLLWMTEQGARDGDGCLTAPERGESLRSERRSDLIVRHLLMPGHLECCWAPVAEWLTAHLPGTKVSLRSGFWPAWKASRHPELRRTVTLEEVKRAQEIAHACKLQLIK